MILGSVDVVMWNVHPFKNCWFLSPFSKSCLSTKVAKHNQIMLIGLSLPVKTSCRNVQFGTGILQSKTFLKNIFCLSSSTKLDTGLCFEEQGHQGIFSFVKGTLYDEEIMETMAFVVAPLDIRPVLEIYKSMFHSRIFPVVLSSYGKLFSESDLNLQDFTRENFIQGFHYWHTCRHTLSSLPGTSFV